ncbi:MAG: CotH kinase family protein [Firmicutes bacterium]|nr:CotH kinase family protein [Bacillota bacterium]MCM1400610.1 CotH kinase family protein [Bacteroides sp.]MCM1476321.1 CotH kinase family protein [Bacteroides sp.]
MKKNLLLLSLLALASSTAVADTLTGTVMGSSQDAKNCFDGSPNTYFRGDYPTEYNYVRNWAGLDLGEAHVITRVGLQPYSNRRGDCRFAVVQGANKEDFSDALPIMVFKNELQGGQMNYLDVNTSRGFRYVRIVATDSQGYFAEIEFEGTPGKGDDSQFYQMTNLPLVSFNTPGMAQIKSKDDKHKGSYVAIISKDGTDLLADDNAQMKGRGNGSWTFPKKPFQIKFNKKQQPLDAPAKVKKWTLINNYGDRTLMRNKVAFDISREAGMTYTPYCTFVDVIYNGEYEGCYQLCDQVEVNPGRVDITEMLPEDTAGEALTGGYFVEIDAYAEQETSWFASNRGIPVTIKSPDEDEIVMEQTDYITNYFNKFESALFSNDFTDEKNGYRQYFDIESFLRYFIVCELDGNLDSFWSMYMWKERGDDLFHVGPVWDVDLGFQNYGSPNPVNDMDDYLYTHSDASKANGMKEFVDRIIKQDTPAQEQLSEMWSQLRYNGNFNYEYFEAKIDEYVKTLDESQKLNFTRWPILNRSVQKGQKVFGTYTGEVNNLKTFLKDRFPFLDKLMGLHEVTGINEIGTDTQVSGPAEYFDMQGRRVNDENLLPGIYVKRTGSKAEKIYVR